MKRFCLNLVTMICVTMICVTTCFAEDTIQHLDGDSIMYTGPQRAGQPVVIIEDFRTLPHDYAKKLTPELYYWWAKANNSRQESRTPASSSGVLQIQEDASIVAPRASVRYPYYRNNGVQTRTNNSRSTTTIREFRPQTGSGPAMIYNPYFR